jgi:hypothetical protein
VGWGGGWGVGWEGRGVAAVGFSASGAHTVNTQPGTACKSPRPGGEQCGSGVLAAFERAAGQLSISVGRL